jgi:hypothetical protein
LGSGLVNLLLHSEFVRLLAFHPPSRGGPEFLPGFLDDLDIPILTFNLRLFYRLGKLGFFHPFIKRVFVDISQSSGVFIIVALSAVFANLSGFYLGIFHHFQCIIFSLI